MQKVINNICTLGSVLLLLYRTSYDCIFNKMGLVESFLCDPLGYIFTLLPVIINLIFLIIKNWEFNLLVIYLIKSVTILAGIISEFLIIGKYELYNIPVSGGGIGKWYMGIGIVIFIIMVEGIIIEFMEEGTFDDVLDYMVDGLPFHYCLFCFVLGLQESIITYPFLMESFNLNNLFRLITAAAIHGIGYFIEIPFAIALLWIIK